jgi:hypothetical protein
MISASSSADLLGSGANDRGSFGYLFQFLLLSGARRGKIAKLSRDLVLSDRPVLPPLSTRTAEGHVVRLTAFMRTVVDRPVTLSKLVVASEKPARHLRRD